jgi:DNA-binding MarR family transcriptional regulator
MPELNEVIHQPVRLRIVAALEALRSDEAVEFTFLRDMLELTDGNLGAHLRKLEEAGYVHLDKTFVDRKPRTYVALTTKGRRAFQDHVEALKAILAGSR